jgi:hypothetical protein
VKRSVVAGIAYFGIATALSLAALFGATGSERRPARPDAPTRSVVEQPPAGPAPTTSARPVIVDS